MTVILEYTCHIDGNGIIADSKSLKLLVLPAKEARNTRVVVPGRCWPRAHGQGVEGSEVPEGAEGVCQRNRNAVEPLWERSRQGSQGGSPARRGAAGAQ